MLYWHDIQKCNSLFVVCVILFLFECQITAEVCEYKGTRPTYVQVGKRRKPSVSCATQVPSFYMCVFGQHSLSLCILD